MKKFFTILLALAMTFALSAAAFAESGSNSGSITINNAVPGQQYTIYRMFDIVSYSAAGTQYKAATAWEPFFAESAPGYEYIHLDEHGTPAWQGEKTDARYQAFAQAAIAWAKENSKENQGQATCAQNATSVVFNDLPLGYYLVDSTLGALCALTNTKPNAIFNEKNPEPVVEKEITEGPGHDGDAAIGDTVHFKATIGDFFGTINLVFKDTPTNMHIDTNSVTVKYTVPTGTTSTDVPTDKRTITQAEDSDGITISFDNTWLSSLPQGAKIIVEYDAVILESAATTDEANNSATLTYGDNNDHTSTPVEVTVHTWPMDILKTDGNNTGLPGAEFVLLNSNKTAVAKWKTVEDTGDKIFDGWETIPTGDPIPWTDAMKLLSDKDGKIHLEGLDAETYYLREIKAPEGGYNMLTEDIKVVISVSEGNEVVTYTFDNTDHTGTVTVINQAGGELPSVGGIGTTIFYIIGGLLMVGAVVLLVVRKKMSVTE